MTLANSADLHKIQQVVKWIVYALLIVKLQLAWGDLVEVIMWLVIIAAIELVVRLQDRNITEGKAMTATRNIKILAYLVLFALAAWWGSLSHWLYTWDTFVWIAGFAAIEMNISEWREEIEDELERA